MTERVKRVYIFFLVLDSLDSFFFNSTKWKILVYTLFSEEVTNINPSFIADDARIMAKRPVVLKKSQDDSHRISVPRPVISD